MARRDLLEARAIGRTITDVALDCGFRHSGRFSRDFRRRFGTRPSHLLKS